MSDPLPGFIWEDGYYNGFTVDEHDNLEIFLKELDKINHNRTVEYLSLGVVGVMMGLHSRYTTAVSLSWSM